MISGVAVILTTGFLAIEVSAERASYFFVVRGSPTSRDTLWSAVMVRVPVGNCARSLISTLGQVHVLPEAAQVIPLLVRWAAVLVVCPSPTNLMVTGWLASEHFPDKLILVFVVDFSQVTINSNGHRRHLINFLSDGRGEQRIRVPTVVMIDCNGDLPCPQ